MKRKKEKVIHHFNWTIYGDKQRSPISEGAEGQSKIVNCRHRATL